jgi:two-component system sensor histidine kinase PilS (NtrC family)
MPLLTSRRQSPVPPEAGAAKGFPTAHSLLQWLYVGRTTVAVGVFLAAAVSFRAIEPGYLVTLAVAAVASVLVTALSAWYTHVRRADPGRTFLYAQALFDLLLVTTVVHVTEGPASQFPALYIPVIAVSSVLMPLASSLLITALASLLYLADIVLWWQPVQLSVAVWLQVAVFVAVFIATGLLASRIRVVGAEREVLEQEVQRLRLEASDILQNLRSGVLTVDGERVLVFANPASMELLGLREEDVGRPLDAVLSARAPSIVEAIARTQATRQRSVRSEGEVRVDDRVFPIGVTTTCIDSNDTEGVPSVTAIFSDISDQKRIEALHLRAERLEAVAELSASLAHEIRNPLASIRSSIEQLAGSSRADEDERVLAGLVLRESDRLSRLLTEFLDFSRVRVAKREQLDVGQVARKAVEVVRQHPDCPADATVDMRTVPAEVEGDEDLLHRVIANLVLNAVQASGASARVVVEVREAHPDDLPRGVVVGPAVLLRVKDDGPGIPIELRERLFEPFVSGRRGGSGLGLAIVQRAVQAHRGVVFVDSVPQAGTTFSVIIPSIGTSEVAA